MPLETQLDLFLEHLRSGDILQAALMIQNGLDMDRDITYNGRIALEVAINDNDLELFKTLVSLGANVRTTIHNSYAHTSLHLYSLQRCCFSIADYIEEIMEEGPRMPHSYGMERSR